MNRNEKIIKFDSKYLKGEALKEVITFYGSKYILKGSTGIGATTAIFNTTNGNRLIISPNVGMIKGKEDKRKTFKSDRQFFIYFEDSLNDWEQVISYFAKGGKNAIINTTPEQIIKLADTKKNLYNKLIQIPVFIDESHAYSTDNTYRQTMGAFMELIYNEWQAFFTLSTATPIYKYIDIPKAITLDYIKVQRTNEPTKTIHYSTNAKDLHSFINIEKNKGNLVVIFTNDKNYHKMDKDGKVKNLVGKNLDIKIAPYNRGNNINDKDLFDCELLICSSAYFAGFDIEKKCSIAIISDQSKDAYKVSVNNAVQAYGRGRNGIENALFINKKQKNISYPISRAELNEKYKEYLKNVRDAESRLQQSNYHYDDPTITKQKYVNRGYLIAPVIQAVNDWQLYNDSVLIESFRNYGFELKKYDNPILNHKADKRPFKERLTNLMELDSKELIKRYNYVKYNAKGNNQEGFNYTYLIEYLTAYLLKKIPNNPISEKLNNKRLYVNEFYSSLDKFFRVNTSTDHLNEQLTTKQIEQSERLYGGKMIYDNLISLIDDWHYLYSIYKVKNGMFTDKINRQLKLYELFHNSQLYKSLFNDKSHRVRNATNSILKSCKEFNITLTDKELKKLKKTIKNAYNELDTKGTFTHNQNIKNNKEKMINAIGFIFSKEGKNFKKKAIKNREYTPLTALPSTLREVLPLKLIEIDITSSSPQAMDKIINTDIGLKVYENLMDKRGISRSKAKTLYNMALNNHQLTINEAKAIYIDCGYTANKALELAQLTAQSEKGKVFELMTEKEADAIFAYQMLINENDIHTYRLHDAILVVEKDLKNFVLPIDLNNYRYHVSYFNNDLPLNQERKIDKMKMEYGDGILDFLNGTIDGVLPEPEPKEKDKTYDLIEYLEKTA